MRIAMVGTGYVGLVSAACFSEFGIEVVCVDTDAGKIENLNAGEIPIYEPGLDALVSANRAAGRLKFTTDIAQAVDGAQAVFIAVGTPTNPRDGSADLSILHEAARSIARCISDYTVVVTKSTVPVGSGRQVASIIREANPGAEFDMVSNPEFLREGAAINDFMRPDRVLIGTNSNRAREVMAAIYRPLYLIETPIVFTSLEAAELTKYAANAFLATKIAFINEMADLCEAVGADVHDVARGIGLDGRIGRKFLHPGPGFGGSCFPKDTRALSHSAHAAGRPSRIVDAVIAVNDERKKDMARRVVEQCDGSVAGKTIAVLGVTFKPNTDDIREAPSLEILPALQDGGAKIRAFDPAGMDNAREVIEDVTWCESAYEAAKDAEAVVIITEWNEFRALDLDRMKEFMATPVMVDLRNIYNPDEMAGAGFKYSCVGRPYAGSGPST
jgi:UDPglucose 6-dehydrogenase